MRWWRSIKPPTFFDAVRRTRNAPGQVVAEFELAGIGDRRGDRGRTHHCDAGYILRSIADVAGAMLLLEACAASSSSLPFSTIARTIRPAL